MIKKDLKKELEDLLKNIDDRNHFLNVANNIDVNLVTPSPNAITLDTIKINLMIS